MPMAKLPSPIDPRAHEIRNDLHRGNRKEALAKIAELIESGKAGAETTALAAHLSSAGKGRQPFGAKHRWYEIGELNETMRDLGVPHKERLEKLKTDFRLKDESALKTAIADYERVMEIIRSES